MDKQITITVNGTSHSVTTDPTRPLAEVLREDLKLTGTKYGCGEGKCGSCTVLVDGLATQSCITPIEEVDGSEIVTIEGIAAGDKLHPLQEAFLAERALQCGYCTPGMIMGALSVLHASPKATEAEILSAMGGHICRCGGYPRILQAIKRAAVQMGGEQR